jgi:hypothetical protein
MSTIVEVMIPHPGGTRPLKKVWQVRVDAPKVEGQMVTFSQVWQFTCIRNAEAFVAAGRKCEKHNDELGMCLRCKGVILL